MSRAFVKENDLEHAGIDIPERPISDEPNYVTPNGLKLLNTQIDALEIIGINSKNYLILPKILGAFTMVPLLVGISAVIGIWGGYSSKELSILKKYFSIQNITKEQASVLVNKTVLDVKAAFKNTLFVRSNNG